MTFLRAKGKLEKNKTALSRSSLQASLQASLRASPQVAVVKNQLKQWNTPFRPRRMSGSRLTGNRGTFTERFFLNFPFIKTLIEIKGGSRRLKSHKIWIMMMTAASLMWAGAAEKPEQSKMTSKN